MAHFAQLDENNNVLQVVVVRNEDIDPSNEEASGITYLTNLFGNNTIWVQTSYNATIRKNYASIGYIYDPVADHFFEPQPYPSWTLNSNAEWQPPTTCPYEEGKFFAWNEVTLSWVEIN